MSLGKEMDDLEQIRNKLVENISGDKFKCITVGILWVIRVKHGEWERDGRTDIR